MAKVKLTRQEIKEIKAQRKILRKKLIARGIRSKAEFERIALEAGLALPNSSKYVGFLGWWSRAAFAMQGLGVAGTAGILATGMGAVFAWSTLTEERGNFTINLTGELLQAGFELSDTPGFEDPQIRLSSDIITEVNAISIKDIPEDVQDTDGSHNGKNYVAYTFYIRNEGERTNGYTYELNLNSHTKNVEYATWIMLFDEDGQVVYAMPSEDGDGEDLFGYHKAPMAEYARDYDRQYYSEGTQYGIRPTPFNSPYQVTMGVEREIEPGEKKKYTVVIWVEGDDPECTNELLGGHAGFTMTFRPHETTDDKEGLFGGLLRSDDDFIEGARENESPENEN